MKTEHKQFKPFDKVIYRLKYSTPTTWHCGIFSDYNEQNNHITLCSGFVFLFDHYDILPYEGNEHLLGTIDEPEEEIKLGDEYVFGITYDEDMLPDLNDVIIVGKVKSFTKNGNFEFFDFGYFTRMYAVRFSDFNPDDMEETKKHILCVKNGKAVKYHGKD